MALFGLPHIRLLFSAGTVFFSHNNSAGTMFFIQFQPSFRPANEAILSFVLEKFISAYLASLVGGSSIYLCMFLNQAFFSAKNIQLRKKTWSACDPNSVAQSVRVHGLDQIGPRPSKIERRPNYCCSFMSSGAGPAAELLPRLSNATVAHHSSFVFWCTVLWALTRGPVQ